MAVSRIQMQIVLESIAKCGGTVIGSLVNFLVCHAMPQPLNKGGVDPPSFFIRADGDVAGVQPRRKRLTVISCLKRVMRLRFALCHVVFVPCTMNGFHRTATFDTAHP